MLTERTEPYVTSPLFDCSRAWVMVIMMEKFVRALQYYYIRWSAVLLLHVGLNLQLAVACVAAWVNCPLFCLTFTWFKKALSWLQAGVSWLRFNCAKAAINGASKLVVTPFGGWKLFIVLIRFCTPWLGVRVVEITETVLPGDPFELNIRYHYWDQKQG